MNRSIFPALLFLILPALVHAQRVQMNDFLATARNDARYKSGIELSTYVKGMNYALPLLQKVEFRMGADETSLAQRQYGIGLGFNSLVQRKEQFQYQNSLAESLQKEAQVSFSAAVQERYLLIAQSIFLSELLFAQNTLNELFALKKKVLRSMLEGGIDVKVKDVILNESDQFELEKNIAQNNLQYRQGLQKAAYFWGSALSEIDSSGLVSLETIADFAAKFNPDESISPNAAWRDAQIALAKNEYRLEKADENQLISTFQLGVQENENASAWQNPFFRLGIRIPIIPYNRLKYNDYFVNIRDIELKQNMENDRLRYNISLSAESLKQMISDYRQQLNMQQSSLTGQIRGNARIMAEITAAEQIELQIIDQKRVIDLVKTANAIRQEYINLLMLSGKITSFPLRNYLRNDFAEWN